MPRIATSRTAVIEPGSATDRGRSTRRPGHEAEGSGEKIVGSAISKGPDKTGAGTLTKRKSPGFSARSREPAPVLLGVLSLSACGLLLLASGCAGGVDLEVARTFQQAQKTFDEASTPEDFLRSAALYQQILDAGVVSGAVLYNQGNAFMRAGERGRAIAAYRRAQRYRPRDPYLEANLNLALEGQSAGQRRPIIEYVFFWQDWLSYPEKFTVVGFTAVTAFVLGIGALFLQRKLVTNLALAVAAVTVLFALSAAYDWYRHDYIVHGVVVSDEVIARKGYATSYEPAFTEPLTEGREFRLVERRGDWLSVRLPGDREVVWVPEDSVVLY